MPTRTRQRPHHVTSAGDGYPPADTSFERRRRTVGLVAGPVLLVGLLVAPLPLDQSAHRLAAVLAMMVALWVTEALPLAVTALLGPLLAIILGVASARTAFAPFADPIIFLFIGSFMLAEAMFVHGVDRRIAFSALASRAVGASTFRIFVVYGAVCAGISMWISNTATTAMMYPIGLSIVAHLTSGRESEAGSREFALALMLFTAFAASIGGIATPIGTPPNLIGIGMLRRILDVEVSFVRWLTFGLPIVLLLFGFLVAYFYLRLLRRLQLTAGSNEAIRDELRRLGPMTTGQRNVLIAFGVTVTLWLLPGAIALAGLGDTAAGRWYTAAFPESVAALTGAVLLFLLPVNWSERRFTLTWDEAVRIDWGIILLFGGGLAMGELAFATGLAESLGRGIAAWLPAHSAFTLTVLFTGVAIIMSEAASNTASANMIVPVAIAVAQAAGVNPLQPALGATLGASMGFMMPISTPPNAIVYASGYVPIGAMVKHGIMLDLAGFVVIVTLVGGLGWILT